MAPCPDNGWQCAQHRVAEKIGQTATMDLWKQVHRPCREHSRTISYREDEARGADP